MFSTTNMQVKYKSANGQMNQHVTFMKEYVGVRHSLREIAYESLQTFLSASNIIMGDLLVCYYTLRVAGLYKDIRWPDPIDIMNDLNVLQAYGNLRLLLSCIFTIRSEILIEFSRRIPGIEDSMIHAFDDCHKSHDENEWYYKHYSVWCVSLVINYGIPLEFLTIKAYEWHIMDVKYMCECFGEAQMVLRGLGRTDAGILHLYRPPTLPERLFPTLRYMLDMEYRMRINTRGEEGVSLILEQRDRSESILEDPETVVTDHKKEE